MYVCVQVRIESDPKEWPAMAAQLAAQRAQREAIQATVRKVSQGLQKAAHDSGCYNALVQCACLSEPEPLVIIVYSLLSSVILVHCLVIVKLSLHILCRGISLAQSSQLTHS